MRARLAQNYKDYMEELRGKTFDELIALAPEITAAKQLAEELATACSADYAKFLLEFDDPLAVVRGFWAEHLADFDIEDMNEFLWNLRDQGRIPDKDIVQPPRAGKHNTIKKARDAR